MSPLPEFRRVPIRPFYCLWRGVGRLRGSYFRFVVVGALVALGALVPFGLVVGPLLLGTHLCFLDQERTGRIRLARAFAGFKEPGQAWICMLLFLAARLGMVLATCGPFLAGVLIACKVKGYAVQDDNAKAVLFLVCLGILADSLASVHALLGFAPSLVVERGLLGVEAAKVSARAAWANFPGLFVLWSVMLFCGYASFLCTGPVFFLFFPVCLGAQFEAFRRVFGEALATEPDPSGPWGA